MLDISGRDAAAPYPIEFFRIELSPLIDGSVFVSLTATTVDADQPQLLDQEIASERVRSLDEVLSLIARHVSISAGADPNSNSDSTEVRFRNYYRCARCGHEWTDEWSAMCDDDCPQCGARHMSPYRSEDMERENRHG